MKALLENPQVLDALSELVALVISLALGATPLLIRWFRAHGVAIDEKQANNINTIARAAAGYADEWARARIKGGEVPSGEEKLAVAIDHAKQFASGALTKMAADKWGLAIQAQLPELRAKLGTTIPPLEALPVPPPG